MVVVVATGWFVGFVAGGVVAGLAGWLAVLAVVLDTTVVGEVVLALAEGFGDRSDVSGVSGVSPLDGSLASSFDDGSTSSLSAAAGCDVVSVVRIVVESSLDVLGVEADSLEVSISANASGGAPLSSAGSFAEDEACDVADSAVAFGTSSDALEMTSESVPDRPRRNPPTRARTAITATPTPIAARLEVFSLPVCTPSYRDVWRRT